MTDEREKLSAGLRDLALDVPESSVDMLLGFLDLLEKWNAVYNLTAIRDRTQWVSHHLLDSLSVAAYMPAGRILDVGTGAGFPGVPLAIVQPGRHFTLLDSSQKRTSFLAQTLAALGLRNADVVRARVEEFTPDVPFDAAVSRAFADLADFARLAGPLVRAGGSLLAMKGLHPDEELTRVPAPLVVRATEPLQVPGLDARRHLVILDKP